MAAFVRYFREKGLRRHQSRPRQPDHAGRNRGPGIPRKGDDALISAPQKEAAGEGEWNATCSRRGNTNSFARIALTSPARASSVPVTARYNFLPEFIPLFNRRTECQKSLSARES